MIIIDTNIAIRMRDGDPPLVTRVGELDDVVAMSVLTRAELEGGVYRQPGLAAARRARLDLLSPILMLPFDETCAAAYGEIVRRAGYSRRKIIDRMIAAQALVHRARLATTNADDFADVPDLLLETWA